MLLICDDFNNCIGKVALGYEGIYGGCDFDIHNIDGERILEFAVANNLVVGNSKFVKKMIIISHINVMAVQIK